MSRRRLSISGGVCRQEGATMPARQGTRVGPERVIAEAVREMCIRDRTVAYAEQVMARAVQYGFTGAGSPTPTSPPLGEPLSPEAEQCAATVTPTEGGGATEIVKIAESQVGEGEHPCLLYTSRCV